MGVLNGQREHRYQTCRDRDCERFPCRVWREGREYEHPIAWMEGYAAGKSAGYAEGYAAGVAAGSK